MVRRLAGDWGWAGVALALLGCAGTPAPLPPRHPMPVVVVAVDHAQNDPGAPRWAPVRELSERGVVARLDTDRPSDPEVVWGEVATGVGWRTNGLYLPAVPAAAGGVLPPSEALLFPTMWESQEALALGWFEPLAGGAAGPGLGGSGDLRSARASDARARRLACESRADLTFLRLYEPGMLALLSAGGDGGRALARTLEELGRCMPDETVWIVVAASGTVPADPPRSLVLDLERLLQRLGFLAFEAGDGGEPSRTERRVDLERSKARVLPGVPGAKRRPRFGRPLFVALLEPEGPRSRRVRELSWTLAQLRGEASGTPLFARIEHWRGASGGGAVSPDLVLWPDPAIVTAGDEAVVRGETRISLFDPAAGILYRYGDVHRLPESPGWVLAAGPPLRRGVAEQAVRPVDLAALIRYLRGVAPPPDLDGRVPRALLRAGPAATDDK